MHALHVFVSGRVQGVSFRAGAARMALALGLTGWVRNLPDGRVELHAEGREALLDALLEWARKGPPQAHIDHVEVHRPAASGDFTDFRIRR